jgi:putative transposase
MLLRCRRQLWFGDSRSRGANRCASTSEPREILDAVFYVVRGGCAWRLLPHDLPLWKTVYHYYFRIWRIATARGSGCTRPYAGGREYDSRGTRNRAPASSVDSQSVKTTGVGVEERGYDPGKRVKGRKRHLLVEDTEG